MRSTRRIVSSHTVSSNQLERVNHPHSSTWRGREILQSIRNISCEALTYLFESLNVTSCENSIEMIYIQPFHKRFFKSDIKTEYENIQKLPFPIQGIIMNYLDIPDECMMLLQQGKEISEIMLSFAEHVLDLDLTKYEEISTETMIKMLQIFCKIKSLKLPTSTDSTIIRSLSHLLSLENLSLEKCDAISDHDLEVLSKLPKLCRLNLSECSNISFEIDHGGFLTLTHLILSRCKKIRDAGIFVISNIKSLKSLNVQNCFKISARALSALSNFENLHFITSTV